ncbi:hypothetical protein [Thermococcus sp.]|uniref:hypothetical protein n=1 Tax=Thermococcus sp. TaxID=35749 RepID=UPI0025FFC6A9|nr:hypothetical protein [Thermococcus sp.]
MVQKMKETLDDKITLTQKRIDLPRNGVIEKIALLFDVTLSNSGASDATITYEDVLKAIEEIRVVADANDIKFSLNGLDVAIMNYYDSAAKSVDPAGSITVPAGGSTSVQFLLFLSGGIGEIHALAKENLVLSVNFNTSISTDVGISAAEVTVTLDKKVFDDANEWIQYYEGVFIEPKVWTKEASFDQLNELADVMNLPTGAIAWRGFIVGFDASSARANVINKYAIIQTKPRRTELLKVDWTTGQQLDKVEYALDSPLTGVTVIDYDKELVPGGFDLREAESGLFKLALKTGAAGRVRYISHEMVIL